MGHLQFFLLRLPNVEETAIEVSPRLINPRHVTFLTNTKLNSLDDTNLGEGKEPSQFIAANASYLQRSITIGGGYDIGNLNGSICCI